MSTDRTVELKDLFIADLFDSVLSQAGFHKPISRLADSYKDIIFCLQIQNTLSNDYYHTDFHNIDRCFFNDFNQVSDINPFPEWITYADQNRILVTADNVAPQDIERSDFFDVVLAPRGEINRGFGLILHRNKTDAAFLSANIPKRFVGADERRLHDCLASIRPLFQKAFHLHMALERRRQDALVSSFWLEQIPAPACIVDPSRSIKLMNDHAARYLKANPTFRITPRNTLSAPGWRNRAKLDTALAEVVARRRPAGPVMLQGPANLSVALFMIPLQFDDAFAYLRFFEPVYRVLIIALDPEERAASAPALIQSLLASTPQESRVIAGLADGHSLRETADMLGISYNTARNHVANLSGRTGFRSQTDLVKSISSLLARLPAHWQGARD